MASGNITVDPLCPDREWYSEMGKRAFFVVYYIVAPIFFVLGTLGHGLCLVAFYHQAKNEKAYVYQIFITVSETLEVFTIALYVVLFQWWASPLQPGPSWYRSCYPCMFFSAYLAVPIFNMLTTASEYFSIFICADRLYALWKPFQYKSTNSRRNHWITVTACVTIGVSTSIFHCFRFYVQPVGFTADNSTLYQVASETVFTGSTLGNALNQARNVVRGLGLVALYVCNVVLIYLYRLRSVEASKALNNNNKEKKRVETERTLAMLAIFQSLCITVSMTCTMLYYTVVFIYPAFYGCKGSFYVPLLDAAIQILDICDFVCAFIVSKPFRKMVLRAIPCWKREDQGPRANSVVTPARTG